MFSKDIKSLIHAERNAVDQDSALLDIESILEASENVDTRYLEHDTAKNIAKENYEILCEIYSTEEDVQNAIQKIKGYRLVDRVYLLHKGRHIRWIRNGKLTNGGVLVNVTFPENGTQILCKCGKRFINYRLDDCVTFQKLTIDEQYISQIKDFVS